MHQGISVLSPWTIGQIGLQMTLESAHHMDSGAHLHVYFDEVLAEILISKTIDTISNSKINFSSTF